MKAIYVAGFWSTNIGNAFFDIGVLYVLKKIFGEQNVGLFQTLPDYAYGITPKKNYYNYIEKLQCNYLFCGGPLFASSLPLLWKEIFYYLSKKGVKLVFISAGAEAYTDKEESLQVNLLKDLKPYCLISRDSETYRRYSKYFTISYDGICFAFFCSDYYNQNYLEPTKNIVINFDKGDDYDLEGILINGPHEYRYSENIKRNPRFNTISEISGYTIIRTNHCANPYVRNDVFRKDNTVISDTPEIYLNIYKNTYATFSERVHACVPTLAFGNYATLIGETPRSLLFDRLGLQDIRRRLVKLDKSYLDKEKESLIYFIAQHLL